MGIVEDDIEQLRTATDVVAVISEYTQLKKVGRAFQGLCPFHSEKSPSFSVNPEDGLYYCFGCGVGGDAITFVREKEQLDFVEAVEMLAAKSGISLRYTDSNEGEDRKRRAALHNIVAKAVDWYHDCLLSGERSGAARSYLRSRGYTGDIVRRYQIGWAPDGWDTLARALGLSKADLVDSGLGFINRAGRQQDAFRERVMFPIYDASGTAVGFGGRKLPEAEGPKYKNSSESSVYSKSRVLYGLSQAKTAIVEADEVIVCEGYTDVIGFDQAGLGRAVATCGTSLTDDHVKLLSRFARRIVVAFDADAAGQNAAARFYGWERTHQLDVRVVAMPDGVDPGDMARTDPEGLADAVANARPFLEFRVDRAIGAIDRSTAEGRAKAAESAVAMVAEHPDPLVRDQYAMTVASRCQFEPNLIRSMLASGSTTGLSTERSGRTMRRRAPRDSPEMEALRLAIHRSDEAATMLVPELFDDELCATTFDLISQYDSLHEVISIGGPEVAEMVQRLAVENSTAEVLDVAGRLWERYIQRQIEFCRLEARGADLEEYAHLTQEMKWYRLRLEELRDPDQQASVVQGLLSWLNEDLQDLVSD